MQCLCLVSVTWYQIFVCTALELASVTLQASHGQLHEELSDSRAKLTASEASQSDLKLVSEDYKTALTTSQDTEQLLTDVLKARETELAVIKVCVSCSNQELRLNIGLQRKCRWNLWQGPLC